MKKGTVRSVIVLAVLLALFLVVSFAVPFYRGIVFWWTFGFSIVSFAVAGISAYIGFVKQPDAKSKFYGFPILKIGAVYLAAQLIAGLIFILVGKWVPVWIPVILYAIGLGAAVIGLVSADAVVEQIQVQDTKLKKNVATMRAMQSKVNQMVSQCDDAETAKMLKELADKVQYSDPVSSEAIADAEADLAAAVDDLQQAVVDGDTESIKILCRKADALLAERNRLCKLNK